MHAEQGMGDIRAPFHSREDEYPSGKIFRIMQLEKISN
jgi:hypothetical protein